MKREKIILSVSIYKLYAIMVRNASFLVYVGYLSVSRNWFIVDYDE